MIFMMIMIELKVSNRESFYAQTSKVICKHIGCQNPTGFACRGGIRYHQHWWQRSQTRAYHQHWWLRSQTGAYHQLRWQRPKTGTIMEIISFFWCFLVHNIRWTSASGWVLVSAWDAEAGHIVSALAAVWMLRAWYWFWPWLYRPMVERQASMSVG